MNPPLTPNQLLALEQRMNTIFGDFHAELSNINAELNAFKARWRSGKLKAAQGLLPPSPPDARRA